MVIDQNGELVSTSKQVVMDDYNVGFYMDLYIQTKYNDNLFIYILVKNEAAPNHQRAQDQLTLVKNMLDMLQTS